jgi:8-oxo-dGTP pyrophosphatase MutT (NUDIX family)
MSDQGNGDWSDAQENAEQSTYEVHGSREVYRGKVISLRVDEVAMPGGSVAERDVVVHPGAVGVVALREDGTVLLLRQYRHPVGETLWELPAGILDVDGEPALQAAQRELGEEAFLTARTWAVLADMYSSPGMSNEAVRLYLARDLEEIPEERRPGAALDRSRRRGGARAAGRDHEQPRLRRPARRGCGQAKELRISPARGRAVAGETDTRRSSAPRVTAGIRDPYTLLPCKLRAIRSRRDGHPSRIR